MTTYIRELSKREYETLTEESDDTLYWLVEVNPDQLFDKDWKEPPRRGIRIQYLDVSELSVYRNPRTESPLFILPEVGNTSYDLLDSIWPAPDSAWAYAVKENLYEDLDESVYYFRDGKDLEDGQRPIPQFSLRDGSTH